MYESIRQSKTKNFKVYEKGVQTNRAICITSITILGKVYLSKIISIPSQISYFKVKT